MRKGGFPGNDSGADQAFDFLIQGARAGDRVFRPSEHGVGWHNLEYCNPLAVAGSGNQSLTNDTTQHASQAFPNACLFSVRKSAQQSVHGFRRIQRV